MKTVAIIVICAFLTIGSVAGTGIYIHSLKKELSEAKKQAKAFAEAQNLACEAEMKAYSQRQAENEKSKQRSKFMENMLDDNGDWSRLECPDDLVRMLCPSR